MFTLIACTFSVWFLKVFPGPTNEIQSLGFSYKSLACGVPNFNPPGHSVTCGSRLTFPTWSAHVAGVACRADPPSFIDLLPRLLHRTPRSRLCLGLFLVSLFCAVDLFVYCYKVSALDLCNLLTCEFQSLFSDGSSQNAFLSRWQCPLPWRVWAPRSGSHVHTLRARILFYFIFLLRAQLSGERNFSKEQIT